MTCFIITNGTFLSSTYFWPCSVAKNRFVAEQTKNSEELTISSTSSFLMVTLASSFSLKAKQHCENNQLVMWTVGFLSVVADGCITTGLVYSKRNKEPLDICPHVKGQQHGTHLSCLAFCSRDLLSPITDMAWNKKNIVMLFSPGFKYENQL